MRPRPDSRADDGIRTRDPHLGKVMRYQLRYVRVYAHQQAAQRGKPYPIPRLQAASGHRAARHLRSTDSIDNVSQAHPTTTTQSTPAQPSHSACEPAAWLGGMWATGLLERSSDAAVLDTHGRWAVSIDFEGRLTLARFANWTAVDSLPTKHSSTEWAGPPAHRWQSSTSADEYRRDVNAIRTEIARGNVYQVNLCRVMSAPLAQSTMPTGEAAPPDIMRLAQILARGNPAPYAGALSLPATAAEPGVHIACASPELFLSRQGRQLTSRPIKGTATPGSSFLDKDFAENIMIVDLVRNDLSIVAEPGSVTVPEFLHTEAHPGLVHLVSGVTARLCPETSWAQIFAAAFPPGSVTGAPKSSALRIISGLEPAPRGPYCGALGWIDADTGDGELAVAIRTFWIDEHPLPGQSSDGCRHWLKFGTGAGITWGSDPDLEWRETELKAAKLVGLASSPVTDPSEGLYHDRLG